MQIFLKKLLKRKTIVDQDITIKGFLKFIKNFYE